MESKDFRNLMESAQDILNESKKKIVPHTPEHKEFREKLAGDDAKRKFDNMTPKQRKAYHQEWMDIQWDSHTHGVEESLSDKTLRSYINKADPEVARVKYGDAKHTPKTNRRARGVIKARARLLAPDELAISPERIADTRKNIVKFLKGKKKKNTKTLTDAVELGESYDKKGLLKKGLTHAVYSKGPSGQIHFTTRRKKFAHKKAEMYTNAIQFNQKEHPGFDVMVVPHGTPEGKSVHPDHEKYYGNR